MTATIFNNKKFRKQWLSSLLRNAHVLSSSFLLKKKKEGNIIVVKMQKNIKYHFETIWILKLRLLKLFIIRLTT